MLCQVPELVLPRREGLYHRLAVGSLGLDAFQALPLVEGVSLIPIRAFRYFCRIEGSLTGIRDLGRQDPGQAGPPDQGRQRNETVFAARDFGFPTFFLRTGLVNFDLHSKSFQTQ